MDHVRALSSISTPSEGRKRLTARRDNPWPIEPGAEGEKNKI